MNKIYKNIWNSARNCYVTTNEFAKSVGRPQLLLVVPLVGMSLAFTPSYASEIVLNKQNMGYSAGNYGFYIYQYYFKDSATASDNFTIDPTGIVQPIILYVTTSNKNEGDKDITIGDVTAPKTSVGFEFNILSILKDSTYNGTINFTANKFDFTDSKVTFVAASLLGNSKGSATINFNANALNIGGGEYPSRFYLTSADLSSTATVNVNAKLDSLIVRENSEVYLANGKSSGQINSYLSVDRASLYGNFGINKGNASETPGTRSAFIDELSMYGSPTIQVNNNVLEFGKYKKDDESNKTSNQIRIGHLSIKGSEDEKNPSKINPGQDILIRQFNHNFSVDSGFSQIDRFEQAYGIKTESNIKGHLILGDGLFTSYVRVDERGTLDAEKLEVETSASISNYGIVTIDNLTSSGTIQNHENYGSSLMTLKNVDSSGKIYNYGKLIIEGTRQADADKEEGSLSTTNLWNSMQEDQGRGELVFKHTVKTNGTFNLACLGGNGGTLEIADGSYWFHTDGQVTLWNTKVYGATVLTDNAVFAGTLDNQASVKASNATLLDGATFNNIRGATARLDDFTINSGGVFVNGGPVISSLITIDNGGSFTHTGGPVTLTKLELSGTYENQKTPSVITTSTITTLNLNSDGSFTNSATAIFTDATIDGIYTNNDGTTTVSNKLTVNNSFISESRLDSTGETLIAADATLDHSGSGETKLLKLDNLKLDGTLTNSGDTVIGGLTASTNLTASGLLKNTDYGNLTVNNKDNLVYAGGIENADNATLTINNQAKDSLTGSISNNNSGHLTINNGLLYGEVNNNDSATLELNSLAIINVLINAQQANLTGTGTGLTTKAQLDNHGAANVNDFAFSGKIVNDGTFTITGVSADGTLENSGTFTINGIKTDGRLDTSKLKNQTDDAVFVLQGDIASTGDFDLLAGQFNNEGNWTPGSADITLRKTNNTGVIDLTSTDFLIVDAVINNNSITTDGGSIEKGGSLTNNEGATAILNNLSVSGELFNYGTLTADSLVVEKRAKFIAGEEASTSETDPSLEDQPNHVNKGVTTLTKLTVEGEFANFGEIATINGLTIAGSGQFTNGTNLQLTDAIIKKEGALTNKGSGSATLTNLDLRGTLENHGEIELTKLYSSTSDRDGQLLENFGTLTITNTAEDIYHGVIENNESGEISITGGEFAGEVDNHDSAKLTLSNGVYSGMITHDSSEQLKIYSSTISGSLTNKENSSVYGEHITLTDSGNFVTPDGVRNPGNVNNQGLIEFNDLTLSSGTINNSGTIDVTSMSIDASSRIKNTGTFTVNSQSRKEGAEFNLTGFQGASEDSSYIFNNTIDSTGTLNLAQGSLTIKKAWNHNSEESGNISVANLINDGTINVKNDTFMVGNFTNNKTATIESDIIIEGQSVNVKTLTHKGVLSFSGDTASLLLKTNSDYNTNTHENIFSNVGKLENPVFNLLKLSDHTLGTETTEKFLKFVEQGEVNPEFASHAVVEEGARILIDDPVTNALPLMQQELLKTLFGKTMGNGDVEFEDHGNSSADVYSVLNMKMVNTLYKGELWARGVVYLHELEGEGQDIILSPSSTKEILSDKITHSTGFTRIKDAASVLIENSGELYLVGDTSAGSAESPYVITNADITVRDRHSVLSLGADGLENGYGGEVNNVIVTDEASVKVVNGTYRIASLTQTGRSQALEVGSDSSAAALTINSLSAEGGVNVSSGSSLTLRKADTAELGTELPLFTMGALQMSALNDAQTSLVVEGSINATQIKADSVQVTIDKGTILSEAGWFENSTITLNDGAKIDGSSIKDLKGNVTGDLGSNHYILNGSGTMPDGVSGTEPSNKALHEAWDSNWKDGFTELHAPMLTSKTIVDINEGSILVVDNLALDGTQNTIHLNGGAFETSTGQFFDGVSGPEIEHPTESATELVNHYATANVGAVKDSVRAGLEIKGKNSWLIFNDSNIWTDGVISVIASLKERPVGGGTSILTTMNRLKVEFSGRIIEDFTVDNLNELASLADEEIVFTQTALVNTQDGVEKSKLTIGSAAEGDDANSNYAKINNPFGFTQVNKADELIIKDGSEFVLLGQEQVKANVKFDASNNLLPDADGVGSVTAESDSTLHLGGSRENFRHSGWIDSAEIQNGGTLDVRRGDFAITDVENQGDISINNNASLRFNSIEGAGSVTVENGSSLNLNLTAADEHSQGTIDNYGRIISGTSADLTVDKVMTRANAQSEFNNLTVSSNLLTEKSSSATYHDLTTNKEAKNLGVESGNAWAINGKATIGEGASSTWNSISISHESDVTNQGTLNVGDLTAQGYSTIENSGDIYVDNEGSISLNGDADGSPIFSNTGNLLNSKDAQNTALELNGGDFVNESLASISLNNITVKSGSFENYSSFDTNNVDKLTQSGGEIVNQGYLNAQTTTLSGGTLENDPGSKLLGAELELKNTAKLTNSGSIGLEDQVYDSIKVKGGELINKATGSIYAESFEQTEGVVINGGANFLTGSASINGGTFTNNAETFRGQSLTVAEDGYLENNGTASFDTVTIDAAAANLGTISFTGSFTVTANAKDNESEVFNNEGLIEQTAGAEAVLGLNLERNAQFKNSSEISVQNFTQSDGSIFTNNGSLTTGAIHLAADSTYIANSTENTWLTGNLEEGSNVRINEGANVSVSSAGGTFSSPTTIENNGSLTVAASGTFENNGNISGSGSINLDSKSKFINNSTVEAREFSGAKDSEFHLNGSEAQVVIAEGGKWFDGTTIYIENGAELSDEKLNGSLGSKNNYVIVSKTPTPTIHYREEKDSRNTIVRVPFYEEGADLELQPLSKFTVQTIDSSNTFTIQDGGYLDVSTIDLDGTKKTIYLEGGILRTSMNQIFDNPTSTDLHKIKSSINTGLSFSSGYLVFDDASYTLEQVQQATQLYKNKITGASGIAFLGEENAIKEILVSDAKNDDVYPGPLEVILPQAKLINDQPEDGHPDFKEDGHEKIVIGNKSDDHDNWEITAQFTLKNAEKIHVIEIQDGRKFGLVGYISGEKDVAPSGDKRIFIDCNIGGTVRVIDGAFNLGHATLSPREGWIGNAEIFSKGAFQIANGNYEVRNIKNNGMLHIGEGSVLTTSNYKDSADQFEPREGTVAQAGSVQNYGSFIYTGDDTNFEIHGGFINHGLTDFNNSEKLSVSGLLDDYAGINFTGINPVDSGSKALRDLDVLEGGAVRNNAEHYGRDLSISEGSAYALGSANSKAEWESVKLDGTIFVAKDASFKVVDHPDLGGVLEGKGSIENSGVFDASVIDQSNIGSIKTAKGSTSTFKNLTLSTNLDSETDFASINSGSVEVNGLLNLKEGHSLQQSTSGVLRIDELGLERNARLENHGYVEVRSEKTDMAIEGHILNHGTFIASAVDTFHIGSENEAASFTTLKTLNSKDGSFFKNLVVENGSTLNSSGYTQGEKLNVLGGAVYNVNEGGRDTWQNIDLTGTINVYNNGKLTVDPEQGALIVHNGYRIYIEEGGEIDARLQKDSARVEGELINEGKASFNTLEIANGATSLNAQTGTQNGHELYVASGSTGHRSDGISEWDIVRNYEQITNNGSFRVNDSYVAGADIVNESKGLFFADKVDLITTAHNIVNEGYATFNDVTLGSGYEHLDENSAKQNDPVALAANQSGQNEVGSETSAYIASEESANINRNARFINRGEVSGHNLTLESDSTYSNEKGTSSWKQVSVQENARFETGGDFYVDKLILGSESDHLSRAIEAPYAAFTQGRSVINEAELNSGVFRVPRPEDQGGAASVTINTVSTPVGASIRVLPSGDLGFGANAISEADFRGAIAPSNSVARVSVSTPVTFNQYGTMYVGTSEDTANTSATGLFFDKGSALVLNLYELGQDGAFIAEEGSNRALTVSPEAELYVNLAGAKKGSYYITRNFDNSENRDENGNWIGGWDGEQMIAIPRNSVSRWKLFFHQDAFNTWLEAKLSEAPDVAAPEVAEKILEGDDPKNPGEDLIIKLLADETSDLDGSKRLYNSLINLAFSGGQLASAYSSMNAAVSSIEERTSMRAEGFNSKGWEAYKTRDGSLWLDTLGRIERVDNYDATKISGAGFESKSYGFILGADHLFAEQNLLTGVAISYQDGKVKSRGNVSSTENKFKTFGAQAYGYWSPNPLINVAFDAGYYQNNADISQNISGVITGFDRAKARAKTHMTSIGARLESTIKAKELSIIPHVGVRWNVTKTESYTTKVNGVDSFKNDPHRTHTMQFPIGVTFRADIQSKSGWKVRPTADLSAVLQAGASHQKLNFSSMSSPVSSTIYGRFTGAYAFVGSLGLQAEKKDVTFGLKYGFAAGTRGKIDHQLKLEAVWRF